jgi:hypothetical protein
VSRLTNPWMVTMAHIHLASTGQIVLPLFDLSATPSTLTTFSGCVFAPTSLLAQLIANPSASFVMVHTTVAPAGAIQGMVLRVA